ncbi:hypothetical protein D3C76_1692190 [compost metagenome]
MIEASGRIRIAVDLVAVVLVQVFRRRDQEARRAAGGVTNGVARTRRHHLDDQLDDMARGAELAVLPGAGDLAEHVFVEVTLGVAILHRNSVEHVDNLSQ